MQTSTSSLTQLARAAIAPTSTQFSPELVLWEESLPAGGQWSGVIRRGNTARFTDLEGRANISVLLFNQEEKGERYNMPDTLKAQHTAFLTHGHVCYSDMGRVLCSIAADTCGWHDTVSGALDAISCEAKYGPSRYQESRNGMHRNAQDGLLIELNKWSLNRQDLGANLNLFSKVVTNERGDLAFDIAHRQAGQYVDLRFEMNVLVVLSTAPHPFDPNPIYQPGAAQLCVWRSGTAGADDECRLSCPENGRGFINTERSFL